jgi:hypothetical protein
MMVGNNIGAGMSVYHQLPGQHEDVVLIDVANCSLVTGQFLKFLALQTRWKHVL